LVVVGFCGCQGGKQAADRTSEGSVGATAEASAGSVAAWATWPMPNSTPGLPNRQSFDTVNETVVTDRVTGLMWQRNLGAAMVSLADAKLQCDRLALAGYEDWRLPSRIELVSILDVTRVEPAIDVTAFPQTPNDWFWTSSIAADDPQAAWYVYFYFGYPKTDIATNQFSSRCVRTAVPHPAPVKRYDTQTDTVRDIGTGLTWQRVVPAKTLVLDAARAYCADLPLAGDKGWRVPSMVELLTLIDEQAASGPMIDRAAFPNTPSDAFWTSTDFGGTPGMAWQVYFDHGNGLYGLPNAMFHVRCVR
jgi:hypothetical protein